MRWAGAVASLLAVAALLWGSAIPAEACVMAPGWDPVEASDVIVGGRVTGWEPAPEIEIPGSFTESNPTAVAIRIFVDVDATFKGNAAASVEIVDWHSVDLWGGEYSWSFSAWDCGYFAGSTTPPGNEYLIIGLREDNVGLREANVFFAGDEPSGERFDAAVSRIDSALVEAPSIPLAIAAVVIPLAFVLAASFVFPARGSRT